ncbi:hypothetical protein SPRG_13288 [Saprolegnia parasitica CBS 223.65]|uniref:Protein kinase domain-containing protein n=1 Tax=Saprolegnia parasitica (strain CBS 223.65) TaxID=695850 RepID=A0A067BSV8_SAPPC|nr:hypothetical protein SPRG_13288 [Saprolegnia parasitica CBS 223.65]KDO21604.1 hypothetical protein SPRG_13288 [Saprolegnia parasitica CBS 223.65]|eukprot:XP_012207691.1 hypothetical protein SPRG_13288 [Saprolegnia parasitica CBS 223.65]
MIMEFMELGALHNYLHLKQFGVPVEMKLLTMEVALVLALALADLHLSTLFLSRPHYVRLGDLGSAQTVGTKFWMAPEVLRDPDHAGEGRMYTTATDIYSFGVILTELDTLCEPYS